MDELNASMSGRTTLKTITTWIIQIKKKHVHTITCSIGNDENKHTFIKV